VTIIQSTEDHSYNQMIDRFLSDVALELKEAGAGNSFNTAS